MKAQQLGRVTMLGPAVDDAELMRALPQELVLVLQDTNGFILFNGGLHVRGAVLSPAWHSLRHAMHSEEAFRKLYASVETSDIPFAQDCFGDQFLLRDGRVLVLRAETGEVEELSATLGEFWHAVMSDPVDFLNFDPDRSLEPGCLLHAYPPFCTKESAEGCSIKSVPALELIRHHADFAKAIGDLPEGTSLEVKIVQE